LALSREEIEFQLSYYNSNTMWLSLGRLLAVFGLTRSDLSDEAKNVFLKGVLPSRKLTFGASYLPGIAFLALKPASGKVFCFYLPGS
jgi:hypothetical protein